MKTLIVCDLQPDVVQKLPNPQQFIDFVGLAVQAARTSASPMNIIYTMLRFEEPGFTEVPLSHPRLGILRKLAARNGNAVKWFTSSTLSITPLPEKETVVTRTTFLPQANDSQLLDTLRKCREEDKQPEFVVVGYGPTVQAMCHLLGDVLAVPNIQILRDCVRDETEKRCQAFLDHGLLFHEQVVSLVEFLEARDLLHEKIDLPPSTKTNVKYVTDCGRGGHISLFLPYLLRDHGYTLWPTQPWYQDLPQNKEYYCPLGKRVVDLCDEPRFGSGTRFFLAGRQYLDEKNLLYDLVPELLPPTFPTIEAAQDYAKQHSGTEPTTFVWFLKKVNQNGGRAITITNQLPTEPLQEDDQLQVHIPRPLLWEQTIKCHVKTYQYIACTSATTWDLYMHDLFYLATASRPWSTTDLSDDCQITTMRTHRLYRDHPWRVQWNLTERCHANLQTVLERAVQQGKLSSQHSTTTTTNLQSDSAAALQFEINSADWMLDEDGKMYLIECNGIPVLYDAGMPQQLCTKGLHLYDRLYKQDPEHAVVNDHDLLKEAIGLALTGKLPKTSLWTHVATISK